MDKVTIKNYYNAEFIIKKIPKLFINLINNEFDRRENQNIFNYIKKYYKLNKFEIREAIIKNLVCSRYADKYIIYIDENYYFKKQNISLKSIINLIDFGNIEVRGINLTNNIFKLLSKNIKNLYKYYLLKWGEESVLWE